jgi:hypothetical protein
MKEEQMTTALQIINRASELIGYKDPVMPLSGDDAALFLDVLNDMVDGWNTGRLNVVATTTVSANVSSSPVSIGSGQTLNTTRPIRIEGGWIRSNSIDYPLEWITSQEYDAIPNKSDTSTLPVKAYYSPNLPDGSIYLWPVPSASVSLHVRVMTQLSQFADLATDYDLAPGYKRAIEFSLAEEIAPGRRPIQPDVARIAFNARRAIKVANFEPLTLESSGSRRFYIRTGE